MSSREITLVEQLGGRWMAGTETSKDFFAKVRSAADVRPRPAGSSLSRALSRVLARRSGS